MNRILEIIDRFREINREFPLNSSVKKWKKDGGKIVGFCGGDIPEEILAAAGVLPYWLRGPYAEIPLESANAYLYIYACSYARSIFETAFNRDYDFLDGVASGPYCDGTRRLIDVWEKYVSPPVIHFLNTPHKFSFEAEDFYHQNILGFVSALEKTFETRITEETLRGTIRTYNLTRTLFSRLYALRKREAPPISGAEVMEVYNASAVMPREEFNVPLENLVDELESTEREVEGKIRLMLNGTILHNPDYVRGIEDMGGLVVADSLLNGAMSFVDMVSEDLDMDPLKAISSYYLKKFPSPRMYPADIRYGRITGLAEEYGVDGVITGIVRYCAPHIYDEPRLKKRLDAKGIPSLKLDLEYGMAATGQVKTRVQAFLEMIKERRREGRGKTDEKS